MALLSLMTDYEHGILYLFYDDNQRIYAGTSELPIATPPYPLTINCRTTRRIHEHSIRFYHGSETPVAQGPEGRPIEFIGYKTGQLQDALLALLERLVTQEGIPAREILVLSPFSRRKSQLAATEAKAGHISLGWSATSLTSDAPERVQIATIYSAKGLERAVIVLVELERWFGQLFKGVEIDKLLYVACSRASNYLLVLLPKPIPAAIRRFFE
jgi:hypothetical protein